MTTALDTNVLSALFNNEPGASLISQRLAALAQQGPLLIHAAVHAELLALPGLQPAQLSHFLHQTGVQLDDQTPLAVWESAGLAFGRYAQRRRKSGGGLPRRLLTDFLIGAHAEALGADLYTLDPQHYHEFAGLKVIGT